MPEWLVAKVAGASSLQEGGSKPSAGVDIESHGLAATSLANREGATVRGTIFVSAIFAMIELFNFDIANFCFDHIKYKSNWRFNYFLF